MAATYVKSDTLAGGLGDYAVPVELSLALDEAARIMGVSLSVEFTGAALPISLGAAAYSFDPEDTVIAPEDDEQFALVGLAELLTGATGGQKRSEFAFLDFSGMNLITSRDLALLLHVVGTAMAVHGRVFYERYRPTKDELVQLIAQRR
jgi:hypothetical protein